MVKGWGDQKKKKPKIKEKRKKIKLGSVLPGCYFSSLDGINEGLSSAASSVLWVAEEAVASLLNYSEEMDSKGEPVRLTELTQERPPTPCAEAS